MERQRTGLGQAEGAKVIDEPLEDARLLEDRVGILGLQAGGHLVERAGEATQLAISDLTFLVRRLPA